MNPIVRANSMDGTATKANGLVPPHRPARSAAWIIAASSFAFAVIQLDVTIVNVALSRISADFGATVADLQWVVDAYTLGFAALLLSAGVVADRFGSKRVFAAGFVGFAGASLACGLAPSPGFLNGTRAIQGIGAALLVPSSLAIINDACAHDRRLRARAIGIWTAAGGVAIAAGPVVGGLLLAGLGWRSIFLVNIPICALGLGLTLRCVPPTQRDERRHRSFDLTGQALAIVALTALVGAVIEARPPWVGSPDRDSGRPLGSRGRRRIYRSRGENCAPDATVALFLATWVYVGNCFWSVGQLFLLRNHFCAQSLSSEGLGLFNGPSRTRFPPAHCHVHRLKHCQWLDGGPNGFACADDPRRTHRLPGIRAAPSIGGPVNIH
jgi:MFS family permease